MATSIISQAQKYRLLEAQRLAIIAASSSRPDATISEKRMAVVHRQRQRFISLNGDDGFGRTS